MNGEKGNVCMCEILVMLGRVKSTSVGLRRLALRDLFHIPVSTAVRYIVENCLQTVATVSRISQRGNVQLRLVQL